MEDIIQNTWMETEVGYKLLNPPHKPYNVDLWLLTSLLPTTTYIRPFNQFINFLQGNILKYLLLPKVRHHRQYNIVLNSFEEL